MPGRKGKTPKRLKEFFSLRLCYTLNNFMSKKKIVIAVGVLIVILVFGAFIFFKTQKKQEIVSPFSEEKSVSLPTTPPGELKTYQDEAGFSFSYSDLLTVKEIPNQDENTYSALELASNIRPREEMTISVLDTNFSNAEEWLVKNKKPGWVINETVISGMNGKLIHAPEKIISVAIGKGIIFLIESPADKEGFWEKQQKIVRENFTVQWPEEQRTSGSSQTIELEEEVIE